MIFPLNIVKPSTYTQEGLICGKMGLCFGDVYKAYACQKVGTIRLLFQRSREIIRPGTESSYIDVLGFELADRLPTVCHVWIVGTSSRLSKDGKLSLELLHQLLYALFPFRGFLNCTY